MQTSNPYRSGGVVLYVRHLLDHPSPIADYLEPLEIVTFVAEMSDYSDDYILSELYELLDCAAYDAGDDGFAYTEDIENYFRHITYAILNDLGERRGDLNYIDYRHYCAHFEVVTDGDELSH